MSSADTRDVVVLVHGTWGRGFLGLKSDASWCEPNASCTRAVRDGLGSNAAVDVFRWSGRNSARARRRATSELVDRCAQLRTQYKQARLHVIAHSHGGNIALYAVKAGVTFASITCFSTPFLLVEERINSGLFDGWDRWKSVAALALLIPLLFVIWSVSSAFRDDDFANALAAFYFAGALPFLAAGWMSARTGNQVTALLDDLSLPARDVVKGETLLIRAPGDETSAVLAMAQLFSRMFAMVSRALLHWRSVSIRGRMAWAVVAFVAPGIFLWYAETTIFPHLTEGQLVGTIILCYYGAMVVATVALILPQFLSLLIAPLIGGAYVLTTIFLLPFGPTFAANSWRLHVASEFTPPGQWSVHQLTAGAIQGLRHGTHSDARALKVLTDWLRSHFAGCPRSPRS